MSGRALRTYRDNLERLGLSERPQQARLVETLDRALDGHGREIAQAGTGVGKTLAALSAAAAAGRSGTPAVVVVGSNGLLGQYVDAAQGLTRAGGEPVLTARVIGARHYVCASSPAARTAGVVNSARQRPGETDDEYRDRVADLFEAREAWLSKHMQRCWSTAFERGPGLDESYACPGTSSAESDDDDDDDDAPQTDCQGGELGGCGRLNSRRRARTEAEIVLTNIDLLVIHARLGGAVKVLPSERAITIVDEAHQLGDKVAEMLGVAFSPKFGRRAFAQVPPPKKVAESEQDRLRREARNRDNAELTKVVHDYRRRALASVDWPPNRPGHRVATAPPPNGSEVARLRPVMARLTPSPERAALLAGVPDERPRALTRLAKLVVSPGDPSLVPTVYRPTEGDTKPEPDRDPDTVYFRRADVGEFVAEMLGTPAALISGTVGATLGAQCGWPDVEPIDVGHPFDYARQARLSVSRHDGTKSPNRRCSAAERRRLAGLRAAELSTFVGTHRALVLCSANSDVRMLVGLLTPSLTARGVRLFVQPLGEGSLAAREVAAEFVDYRGPACLVGTASYATGLDIPGPQLDRVAWWSLPLGSREPVDEQRQVLLALPGSRFAPPWALPTPETYLDDRLRRLVAQGVGRLIRTASDSGEILLCDSRFGALLASADGLVDRHLAEIPRHVWRTSEPISAGQVIA